MFVLADIRRGRARSDGCDVSQAGVAAVVTTNGRGLPGRKHQKLHQLVARRQSLQRHPAQKQVGVTSYFVTVFYVHVRTLSMKGLHRIIVLTMYAYMRVRILRVYHFHAITID